MGDMQSEGGTVQAQDSPGQRAGGRTGLLPLLSVWVLLVSDTHYISLKVDVLNLLDNVWRLPVTQVSKYKTVLSEFTVSKLPFCIRSGL